MKSITKIILSCFIAGFPFIGNLSGQIFKKDHLVDWNIDAKFLKNGDLALTRGESTEITITLELQRFDDPAGGFEPVNFTFGFVRLADDFTGGIGELPVLRPEFNVTSSDFPTGGDTPFLTELEYTITVTASSGYSDPLSNRFDENDKISFYIREPGRNPPFVLPQKDYDVIIQEPGPVEPDPVEPGPGCQEELLLTTNISGATLVVKEAEVKITASNELASGTNVVYSAPTIILTNGFWARQGAAFETLSEGCSQTVNNAMVISSQENDAFAPEQGSAISTLKFYPNPVQDKVTFNYYISDQHIEDINFQIRDELGEDISQKVSRIASYQQPEANSNIKSMVFNLENLSPGIYYYSFRVGNKLDRGQIIKN